MKKEDKNRKDRFYYEEYNYKDEGKRHREKKREKKLNVRDAYMFTTEDESLPRKSRR